VGSGSETQRPDPGGLPPGQNAMQECGDGKAGADTGDEPGGGSYGEAATHPANCDDSPAEGKGCLTGRAGAPTAN
jgi:hypothetical protein